MFIDALDFARAFRKIEGQTAVQDFSRLCQDFPQSQDGDVLWQVAGRYDASGGRMWLDIQAHGPVRLTCQRCLGPMQVDLQVDNTVGLVRDQAQMDALDALDSSNGDADIEYLLAERQLDVLALIEDELILALPYVPRHDVCPVPAGRQDPVAQDKPSPFAVLERLRKH